MADYVISANVTVQPLYDTLTKNNVLAKAVVRAVLTNNENTLSVANAVGSIPTFLQNAHRDTFDRHLRKYYNYGKFYHPDGLPKSSPRGGGVALPWARSDDQFVLAEWSVMETIIRTELGYPISVIDYWYGYPEESITVLLYMLANSGFIPAVQYHVTDNRKLPIWDQSKEPEAYLNTTDFLDVADGIYKRIVTQPSFLGTTITFSAVEIEYNELQHTCGAPVGGPDDPNCVDRWWAIKKDWEGQEIVTSYSKDISADLPFNSGTALHLVRYANVETAEVEYWFYDQADNLYPSIHQDPPPADLLEGTYPFAVIVEDGLIINEGGLGDDYKIKTTTLLDKLGINLDEFMDGMVDPDDPNNLEDVTDAFILFAPSLGKSDDHASLAYFYELFRGKHHENLAGDYSDTQATHLGWINSGSLRNNIVMYFKTPKTEFHTNYLYTTMKIVTGNISNPTPYLLATIVADNVVEIDEFNNGHKSIQNGVPTGHYTQEIVLGANDDTINSDTWNDHAIIIRKQLTDTTYVELAVVGFQHKTVINRYRRSSTIFRDTVLANMATADRGQCFIPLDTLVLRNFNSILRSDIEQAALSFVVQTLQAFRMPWWSSAIFIAFVQVVILIYTWQDGGELATIIGNLIIQYAVSLAVTEALEILVDLIGGKAALILAAILAAYAISKGGDTKVLFDLLTADQLLAGATYMITAVNNDTMDKMTKVAEKVAEEEERYETASENLEDIEQYLAGIGTDIDLISIRNSQPYTNFNETVDQFLNRSCHHNNSGVSCLDQIDGYVNNLLTLPTTPMNEFNYGYDVSQETLLS